MPGENVNTSIPGYSGNPTASKMRRFRRMHSEFPSRIASGRRYALILAANGDRLIWDYKRALGPDGTYVTTGGSGSGSRQAVLSQHLRSEHFQKRRR